MQMESSRTATHCERNLMMMQHHTGEQQASAGKESEVAPSSMFPNMRMSCSRNEDMMNSTEEQRRQNSQNAKHGVWRREQNAHCWAQEHQRCLSHARPKVAIKREEGILGIPPRKCQEEGKQEKKGLQGRCEGRHQIWCGSRRTLRMGRQKAVACIEGGLPCFLSPPLPPDFLACLLFFMRSLNSACHSS